MSLPTLRSWSAARLAGATPSAAKAIPVPIVAQTTDFSCGAAALLAVLTYWLGKENVPRDEKGLWAYLGTNPTQGTNPDAVAGVAGALGLETAIREGVHGADLPAIAATGATAILALRMEDNEDPHEGHWIVLVGATPDDAIAMDPLSPTAYVHIPLDDLDERMRGLSFDGLATPGIAVVIKRKAQGT